MFYKPKWRDSKKGAAFILGALMISSASAGESGVFLGLGAGFGFEGAAIASLRGDQNNTNMVNGTTKALGAGAELLVGYKFFFTERIGLRGYLSTDYSLVFFGNKSSSLGVTDYTYGVRLSKLSGLLDMNLNVDFLFDIMSSDSFSLGIFAGLAGGFHLWHGGVMDEANGIKGQATPPTHKDGKTQSIFGSVGLNLGLNIGLGTHHSLEFLSKIPFLEDTVVSYTTNGPANSPSYQSALKLTRPYSLALRYVYSF